VTRSEQCVRRAASCSSRLAPRPHMPRYRQRRAAAPGPTLPPRFGVSRNRAALVPAGNGDVVSLSGSSMTTGRAARQGARRSVEGDRRGLVDQRELGAVIHPPPVIRLLQGMPVRGRPTPRSLKELWVHLPAVCSPNPSVCPRTWSSGASGPGPSTAERHQADSEDARWPGTGARRDVRSRLLAGPATPRGYVVGRDLRKERASGG